MSDPLIPETKPLCVCECNVKVNVKGVSESSFLKNAEASDLGVG
jgi:hypothetical protein